MNRYRLHKKEQKQKFNSKFFFVTNKPKCLDNIHRKEIMHMSKIFENIKMKIVPIQLQKPKIENRIKFRFYFSPKYSPIARLLKPISLKKKAAVCSEVFCRRPLSISQRMPFEINNEL